MDKDLLYRFFEGRVSKDEKIKIKEWAESSEENNAMLLRERKLFNAMILMSQPHHTNNERRTSKSMHLVYEIMKVACVIALTAGTIIGINSIGKDNKVVAMQTITVPAGQRVNVDLPDGTNVWLNAGTVMKYPLSFLKDKREVTIDGEAYFDVAKNEKVPFIVQTPTLNVKVLGTKFNVIASSKRNVFETTLMEGKINVFSPKNEKNAIILLPNQKATFNQGKLLISKVDDFEEYRWKEGLYCFKDKTFREIIQNLEKYYDINIIINKKNIDNEVLTGKFRIVDGLDYALRVLQNSVKFDYHRDKEKDIIYIK